MEKEKTIGKKVQKDCRMNYSKSLEGITLKEATIKDLEAYFEKNKYPGYFWQHFSDGEGKKYFSSCMNFLKSFELNPGIIAEFNLRAKNIVGGEALGIYLSTLIQTSYNKGFNNFTFEKVNVDKFGAFLKGQPKNPIKITAKTLKADGSLWNANGCSAEIQNYQGIGFGGYKMENCTIKSGNEETLEMIKEQATYEESNRFELKK